MFNFNFLLVFYLIELISFISAEHLAPTKRALNLIPLENGSFITMTQEEVDKTLHQYRRAALESETKFYLYTKTNPNKSHELSAIEPEKFKDSHFNKCHPTKIIVHGWTKDKDDNSVQIIKNAYLQKGKFNLILVDWSPAAKQSYLLARGYIETTSRVVANFIEVLIKETDISYDNITLVGFSLGGNEKIRYNILYLRAAFKRLKIIKVERS